MGKRKLTDKQIINIANSYATESDAVNMSYLSSIYGVSASTISSALHFAISNVLVDERIAKLIAKKAIEHDNVRNETFGYSKSNKVTNVYNHLLKLHSERSSTIIDLPELKSKLSDIRNHLDSYDEVYSSSDEYPFTKEDLEKEFYTLEEQIKKIESTLK